MEPIRPLRLEDGALLLLDQTALPAEERWLRLTRASEVAGAIRRLAVRGAPAIGLAAAYGLAVEAMNGSGVLRERVQRAAALLRSTRPTAVNLSWALDRALLAFEREPSAAALVEFAEELAGAQLRQDQRIADAALEWFPLGARVLTHCNTGPLATGGAGTAGGAIVAAARAGRVAHVWVDETRPLLQGARLTAWEFGRAAVPYEVVTDSSAGALMARGLVDLVIVGGDRIAANGDVANKIGTYALAVLAGRHGIPFVVAAPTSTIDHDTPSSAAIEIEERAPEEVLGATAAPGASARNFAFDVTPAQLVGAIVTDAGVMRPPYGEAIAQLRASAALAR